MEAQTYSVFQAVGSRESFDLLLELLEGPGVVEDLRNRAGISKSTASRRLDELALAGLIARGRPRDPYELSCPDHVRSLLLAAHNLAQAILEGRRAAEDEMGRRIRS